MAQEVSPTQVQSVDFSGPHRSGLLPKGLLDEASGIANGITNSNVLWIVNDSGNEPAVYAVSPKGEVLCTLKVKGAKNVDWEDLCIKPGDLGKGVLVIGDIGDNNGKRKDITIYMVDEPKVTAGRTQIELEPKVITATYPDGARDAEALMFDPLSGDLFIVSKRDSASRVYRLAGPLEGGSTRKLEKVATLPMNMITAGDISVRGTEILLKNYLYTYHWTREYNESVATALNKAPRFVRYMPEPQGEAICWSIRADGYYTTSERPDTTMQTELLFYRRELDQYSATMVKDTVRPPLAVEPSRDTKGLYTVRYSLDGISKVRMTLHNSLMMPIKSLESGKEEQGALEREIDMKKNPAGFYVVTIRVGDTYNAVAFSVDRD